MPPLTRAAAGVSTRLPATTTTTTTPLKRAANGLGEAIELNGDSDSKDRRSNEKEDSPKPSKRPRTPARTTITSSTKKPRLVPATPNPAPAFSESRPAPIPASSAASVTVESSHIIPRPSLSFSYAAARDHLISIDERFRPLMDKLKCKPFEQQDDTLNPFRALCSSILGQQISWLAARSITYKFIRLVCPCPELPEKPDPSAISDLTANLFPTPEQVVACDIQTLRSAGLSQRKAEYIKDLAQRFKDGRLSAEKLVQMDDEQVMQALTEVRGVGRWTVEMFMIFTLHRPDVLPCGDLGVQKGLIRWLTCENPSIHARKLPDTPGPTAENGSMPATPSTPALAGIPESEVLQTPQSIVPTIGATPRSTTPPPRTSGLPTSAPSTPLPTTSQPNLPLLTPAASNASTLILPPFPSCSTIPDRKALSARLNKKIKGNIYLSPQEMQELTESWRPFRSIGVWYLWSLSDADTSL